MRERPIEDKPSAIEVALVLILIMLVMAFAGKVDFQEELEQENRALRATVERYRMAESIRVEPTIHRGEQP